MEFEEWKAKLDLELEIMDKLIALLTQLRDVTACSSYPNGLDSYGLRKKQPKENDICGK